VAQPLNKLLVVAVAVHPAMEVVAIIAPGQINAPLKADTT
jgi:hypothetical protein